jgi:hypothetical protein
VWGNGGTAPPYVTSALDGGGWSAWRPGSFTPGEKAPGNHCIGGWMGPRFGLDAVDKRKILYWRESNPGRSARSPSLYRLSYPDSHICYTPHVEKLSVRTARISTDIWTRDLQNANEKWCSLYGDRYVFVSSIHQSHSYHCWQSGAELHWVRVLCWRWSLHSLGI